MSEKKQIATIDGKRLLVQVIKSIRFEDGDILFIQTAKPVHPAHADFIIQSLKDAFTAAGITTKVPLIIADNEQEIRRIPAAELPGLGLITIEDVVRVFGEDALEKLGLVPDIGVYIGEAGEFKGEMPGEETGQKTIVHDYILHLTEGVTAEELAQAYGVPLEKCIVMSDKLRGVENEYFNLYPRIDGNYRLPTKRGR